MERDVIDGPVDAYEVQLHKDIARGRVDLIIRGVVNGVEVVASLVWHPINEGERAEPALSLNHRDAKPFVDQLVGGLEAGGFVASRAEVETLRKAVGIMESQAKTIEMFMYPVRSSGEEIVA